MFNLVRDDFDENSEDILYSTKKIQLKLPTQAPFSAYRSNFSM